MDSKDYTHSSLRGQRDPATRTGKFKIPDSTVVQAELATHCANMWQLKQPLTLVEVCTRHFPYSEDIDIEATRDKFTAPPDVLVPRRVQRLP